MKDIIKINTLDNSAVALKNLFAGQSVFIEQDKLIIREDIKAGHKIALTDIKKGEPVVKYGHSIGRAFSDIKCGSLIHSHNLKTNLSGVSDYSYSPVNKKIDIINQDKTFLGFARENGEVGIRNEIWIIPLVGCVNKLSEKLARIFEDEKLPGNVSGVFTFTHPYGCSQLGDDALNTQKILSALVKHPNAGGVLVIGLGCENNNMESFKKVLGEVNRERVMFLTAQESEDEIKDGVKHIRKLIEYASGFNREPLSVSKLKVGLKCGGSDGFSGLTANPLVGAFTDKLIMYGGSAVLTEVPESFGAEDILLNRSISKKVFDKAAAVINDFKKYFLSYNQPVYENPSPGNIEGGITTLEEKSLGSIQKSGSMSVVDVLEYGERVTRQGLNFLNGPGNDIVSSTNLAASSAHLILFTTGRGTPFGSPVPTIKISSNSPLFEKKPNWIDFNAGELLENINMEMLTEKLFDYVVKVASGELCCNERNNYREIAIFKNGVTL